MPTVEGADVRSVEHDPALDGGGEAQKGAGQRRLAAAALANYGEDATPRQAERDVAHGAHDLRPPEPEETGAPPILDGEARHFEEGTGLIRSVVGRPRRTLARSCADARGLRREMAAGEVPARWQLQQRWPGVATDVGSEGAAAGEDTATEAQRIPG